MRSRFVMTTVVAVALACLAAPLLAQQPGGGQGGQGGQRGGRGGGGFGGFGGGGGGFGFGGGGGTSRLTLLNVEAVQKELELVDEQLTAINKVREELRPMRGRGGDGQPGGRGRGGDGQPGGRGRRGGGDNPPTNPPRNPPGASLSSPAEWYFVQQEAQPPQRRGGGGAGGAGGGGFGGFQLTEEQRAEFEKQRLERLKQEKDKLAEILLPHQMKRLNEIYYQQLGASVVDDPDVVAELKITDDQKKKFTTVRTENQEAMRTAMQEIFQGGNRGAGGGGFQMTDEQRAKMTEARKKNDDKIFAVLTEEQRKKLDELKGKAFAMPEGALRGRGGFGGGGAPGGAPGGRGRGGNNPNPNP